MKLNAAMNFVITGLITSVLLLSCSDQYKSPSVDPAFSAYISAFTSGVVSTKAPIIIRLHDPIVEAMFDDPSNLEMLFEFSPELQGTTRMEDDRTIVFQPDERLSQDREHQVSFNLGKALQVPQELAEFVFHFRTLAQSIEPGELSLAPYDHGRMERQKITGTLHTADDADPDRLEKTFKAVQNGNDLKVSWSHSTSNREHRFTVDSVKRMELASEVKILVDGDAIDVNETYEILQEIPALGDFKILSTKAVHQPDQFALITFSDR